MKRNISIVKPIGFLMLFVLFASFMAAINVSVVQASPEHLLINEFMIQPRTSEAIELYNPTASSIDLSTWILSDRPLPTAEWPGGEGNMTLSGTIAAGGYSVFYPNNSATWGENALGNEGDDLYLYNETSPSTYELVDSVAYGPMGGCPEPEYGWSAARAPNGIDTDDDAANWNVNASTGPTMGSANNAPPAALSESPIVINEVLANPSGMPEFIELYNNGSEDVNIIGWFFSDGDDTIVINETSIVPAYSFWVVYSNASYWQAAVYMYGLDNYEDNVYLFNSTGHRLDQMGWTSNHGDGTSIARFSDGVGKCYAYNDTTLVENGWAEERRRNGSPGSSNDCTHIWVSFYASPSFVRMRISNISLVYADIANMLNATTVNVNVTLTLPSPNVTLTPASPLQNLTVVLGNLDPFNVTTIVWNVTVNEVGLHWLTLNVTAEFEPDPRPASESIQVVIGADTVFDFSHDQYYDLLAYNEDLIPILQEIGPVLYNYETITDQLLEDVSLLIIPDPNSDFIANETEVIKNWLENKNGSLLIMGTWHKYLEPDQLNNITLDYGIEWLDMQVIDEDDNDGSAGHHPLIYNWTDNTIANYVSYEVTSVESGRTCALNVSGNAVPIATGDDDPWPDKTYTENYTYNPPFPPPYGPPIINGSNVIPFAAVNLTGGGRIFASGSSAVFIDGPYYMGSPYDNERFARNVIAWLMRLATGEANFTLSTMYNVTVKANLNLKAPGASLVVRFHTYSGVYKGNATVWSGATPTTVTLAMNVTIGLPVEVVTLVLTDDSGNIWVEITSFVVRRSDLFTRLTWLDNAWIFGWLPKPDIFLEIIDIDGQWPYAPS